MADLGMDEQSLRIKALDMEVTIDELRLAQKRMEVEILRGLARIEECKRNIIGIGESIAQRTVDLDSTRLAADKAGGKD